MCIRDRGYGFTDDEMEADVIVVNTCCFIGDAKEESVNTILEMAEHKKDAKCKLSLIHISFPGWRRRRVRIPMRLI